MKFQKTLLAASLAVVAVAANAQNANPVSVTENLFNLNQIYGGNGSNVLGSVDAPVNGISATHSAVSDVDTDWLPGISFEQNGKVLDLGKGKVQQTTQAGALVKYDVFKYKTQDGTTVYRFENTKDGSKVPGYYVADATGQLTAYAGTSQIDVNTLQKGGQIEGQTGSTNVTGFENRQVNGERIIYGYQGGNEVNAGNIKGNVVAPDGSNTNEHLHGALGQKQTTSGDVRYVQQGIIANTGSLLENGYIDPSKNIYGVSARDNNNVVMMTGNGIALADLSNKGALQTDGSVASSVLVKAQAQGVQKTREYDVDGKRILEVYNNDEGRELASKYYEIVGNGQDLVEWKGTTPVLGSHSKTGTAEYNAGTFDVSKVHNTVTNKNVTYSESVSVVNQDQVKAGITNPDATTTNINKTFTGTTTSETKQQVSTGVIGTNEDKTNKYGTEVSKTVTADGTTTTEKTTITAGGISTTGTINAKDYQINGVSIVDNIKTSVDGAVAGATEAIDKKVAQVDEKIVEVDKRLTQFNSVAGELNGRVDQLNNRIDDVEKTAYRGVAIALAAQQAIPNLGAGQTAVFGGAGVYKSEGAGAIGVATVLADGRTSFSGALGIAGGNEVGGRLGVSYVFGGK